MSNSTTATTTATAQLLPAGFLSTDGSQIIDANGTPVRIDAVNWYGAETTSFAPGGLNVASYKTMMNEMVQTGFNTIRLPFSLQALDPSSKPASWAVNTTLNPDLAGLDTLQVIDAIVAYAGKIGLKVILDDHRSAAGDGPNADGLWYDSGYTDAQWTSDWKMLASHFAGNTTVIGADLSNEPHGSATWGDGNLATDWEAAATRAGDAIQTVNPNWLVFVEGVQNANGVSTMWGENLTGVAAHPVTLTDPGHVVYSPHDYPSSVSEEPYFTASNYPNNLPSVWTQDWGYIAQQGIAPVFLGEFGSTLQTTSDQQWLSQLVKYLDTGTGGGSDGNDGISWAYWDWNPDSTGTGGILEADWTTVDTTKTAAIAPLFTAISTAAVATSPASPAVASPTTSTAASTTTTAASTTTTAASTTTTSSAALSAGVSLTTPPTGAGYQAAISLGNGPVTVGPTGLGCVITGGDGAITVGKGASAPLGNAWIKLGNGNDSVVAFGTHDVVTCGNGNDVVLGMQGAATVTLGNGDNVVVAFGAGNAITVGDTASPSDTSQLGFINAAGGGSTVTTGNGTFYVLGTGSGDVVTTGATSRAFIFETATGSTDGAARIHTGGGNDWIVLAGTGNTVDAGAGLNMIYGSGGGDTFTLEAGGTDFIHGAGLQSADRLDLSTLLAGTKAGADLSQIGRYVQVASSGSDAWVNVDPTGSGTFSGAPAAVLFGDAGATLAQMRNAGMFKFS